MATLARPILPRLTFSRWLALWLLAVAVPAILLGLLTAAIKGDPIVSQDRTVLDHVAGWDLPGLTGSLEVVSSLTGNYPAMALGLAGILFLWLIGLNREALAFAVIGGTIGGIAWLGDFTLGEYVDRSRPLPELTGPSFPSGRG